MFEISWIRPCLFVLLSTAAATAAEFDVDSLQERIYATIESVKPAVVSVRQRGGMFSGVIVSKEGQVLSAGHAVRPGDRYQVLLPDGRQLTAVGKGSNPQADCALLQITSEAEDLPFVRMGESDSLVRNQPCLSISFPGGQGVRGVPVVRFGRLVNTGGGRRMLQSTALMEPGDSGGPLFDLQGRVIGIHSRIGQSMTRNYEVDVNTFKKFWNELNREQSFTQSGPPVPKLGFRGVDRGDGIGISVMEIVENSLAANHGIEPEDVIQTVYGRKTPSIRDLRRALVAARDDKIKEIVVKIRREEEELEITVPFDVESESAPEVELPVYSEQEFSAPQAIDQLANLPMVFSELESELDDACVEISSKLSDEEELSIVGTLINATPFIVSKSSMVGDKPTAQVGDSTLELEVVSRDKENDLVLLKSSTQNSSGIDLNTSFEEIPGMGSFLITPDASGPGLISVVSTKAFTSRKQQSRGFLGVVPEDYKQKAGAVLKEVTKGGAADRAGLLVGDVVTKMNDTVIATHMEMRRFLGTLDPNATVVATIQRGEDVLEKIIRLGAFPSFSNHAADQMNKSGRRDGFSQVIPHDADLKPTSCGGPLFDLEGNFVGLNIARNSRVRSYAIPGSIVKELVDQK
ncbi:MAG: trypsin-like peptidase domain-containing protein [Rubripirellula sp.]